jgi:Subtilase family.
VAYSSVPRWNVGDEVEQGTSMAAPHATGLVALLVSAMAQERRTPAARQIRQALMVTAQPTPGATFVDEGAGLADVDRAYRWLVTAPTVAEVQVRAIGPGDATGAMLRGVAGAADTTQGFELATPAGAPAAYTLRSDAPWLTAPATTTLRGTRTVVPLMVARHTLAAPGAYVGTVTGWTHDTMAGPAFRLVTTVVVAARLTPGTQKLRDSVAVPAGGILRTFFEADSARPFALTVEAGGRAERALAFLHEPDGMPFRDESARTAGFGPQSAEYEADSRDVVRGAYESVVVAPPNQALTASVSLSQSPLLLHAARHGGSVRAALTNVTGAPVRAEVGMHLGGAARVESVSATGSAPQRIPFVVPSWSRGVVVDITMDRVQWGKFTDFGVTLFDSLGRQLGKQPLNYAFGRLQVELPEGHSNVPVTLGLFPGFADPAAISAGASARRSGSTPTPPWCWRAPTARPDDRPPGHHDGGLRPARQPLAAGFQVRPPGPAGRPGRRAELDSRGRAGPSGTALVP